MIGSLKKSVHSPYIPNMNIKDIPNDPTEPTSSSTTEISTTDCGYPLVDNLGKCTLVMPQTGKHLVPTPVLSWLSIVASAMRTTSLTSTPPASSWSCTCAGQTQGQVVNATTKCGTPMCPNWQTTTTRTTTRIDTRPLFTFTDPPLLTFPRASCACSKPTVSGVGLCSTVHNSYFSGTLTEGPSQSCGLGPDSVLPSQC